MLDTLRIAQVSPYGLERYGGVRSHIRGLGEALQAQGHSVTVVAPGTDGNLGSLPVLGVGRVRTVQFSGSYFDLAWASAADRRRISAESFDIMHLHAPWSPALPMQLAWRFRGARVGTFHDVAGRDTPALARRLMPLGSAIVRRLVLDETIAVSPSVSVYLGRGTHVVISNGVEAPADLPPRTSTGAITLLYVGRLEPRKDVETLLRAMALLGSDAPSLRIVGDGPSRAALESMQRSLSLHSVGFLGAVSDEEKWAHMRASTCLIAPSAGGESFGIVLLEAMTAGMLPIAADNPGYRDVMGHDGASLSFPPGDAAALATIVRRVVDDRRWRETMQHWARTRYAGFVWPAIAAQVEVTYRRALQRRHR